MKIRVARVVAFTVMQSVAVVAWCQCPLASLTELKNRYSIEQDKTDFCKALQDRDIATSRATVYKNSPIVGWQNQSSGFSQFVRDKLTPLRKELEAASDATVISVTKGQTDKWTFECIGDPPESKRPTYLLQSVNLVIDGRDDGNGILQVFLLNFPHHWPWPQVGDSTAPMRVVWVFHGHKANKEMLTGRNPELPEDRKANEGRPLEGCLAGRLAAAGYSVLLYTDPTQEPNNAYGGKAAKGFERVMKDAVAVQRALLEPYSYEIDAVGLSGGAQRLFFLMPILKRLRSAYLAGYFSPNWVAEFTRNHGAAVCKPFDLCYDTDFERPALTTNYMLADLVALALSNDVRVAFASNAREGARAHKVFLHHELVPMLLKTGKPFELRGDDLTGNGKPINGGIQGKGLCHEYDTPDYLDFLKEVRGLDGKRWPNGYKRPDKAKSTPLDQYCPPGK